MPYQGDGDDQMNRYVAEFESYRSITAHYPHTKSKINSIVRGEGIIQTRIPISDEIVVCNTPIEVRNGDCYPVQAGEVHQSENTGPLPMIAITVFWAAHMGSNRFIVTGAIPH
jgi:mannose-6-phosphate isomerase-like protein (cupin superfamily)